MITIIGPSRDATLSYLESYLSKCGTAHRRLTWQDIHRSFLARDEALFRLSNGGAYIREPPSVTLHALALIRATYVALAATNRQVIRPSIRSSNWSKPLHYDRLASATQHLRIPAWDCTTGDASPNGFTVVKPASSLPGAARRASSYRYDGLEDVPVPFVRQSECKGTEIRVHVVGDTCISTAIRKRGGALDYKLSATFETSRVSLPCEIQRDCCLITRSEGLVFSGIDILVDGDTYWLLEVNPMPGYHTFEMHLTDRSTPISDALVAFFSSSEGEGA